MKDFLTLATTRRSIRKFTEDDIPLTEIENLIKIAVSAPSGCNSQCWKFVAVKDKEVIDRMANAVIQKINTLLAPKSSELNQTYIQSKHKIVSFFRNAPVVVVVFMTHLKFYDETLLETLKEQGYNYDDIMELFVRPDLLSVGAAIQNLLLAAHEKGYGACWMNEPAVAGGEIAAILEMPPDCKLVSLIPIGIPAYIPREKPMKDLAEVFKIFS